MGLRRLPGGAFAAAGDIRQHPVEETSGRRIAGGILHRGDAISGPQATQVAPQNADAIKAAVVGHDGAAAADAEGDLSGFIARSGAEIEDSLSRLRVQEVHRQEGDFFLHVVLAGDVLDAVALADTGGRR